MIVDRRAVIAALLAPGLASAATVTPLRVVADRIYIAVRINGRATEALLDSGAEMTVLDRRFAAGLGLGRGTPATARGTGAATTPAALIAGVAVDVAGLALRPAQVAVIDLADISARLAHRRIDAIVGRNLFDAARLSIDLARGHLRISADAPPGVRLPLTARRGIETVPLTIEGHAVRADFDLGNGGRVLVGGRLAARLLRDGRATGRIGGGGIGGETVQRSLVLRDLILAGRRFTNVPAAIDGSPTAADANIGVRILRHYGIVTDFRARSVWLDAR